MNILTQLSKYLFILLIFLFTLRNYLYLSRRNPDVRERLLIGQTRVIFLMTIMGYVLLFLNEEENIQILVLLIGILLYNAATMFFYRVLYPKASMLLVNNMLMLLNIGFIMIARLNFSEAFKQFLIAAAGTVIAFLIPVMIRKIKVFSHWTWLYAIIGIIALMGVFVLATVSGGAKLSVSVGGITIQFSELVKITLVFFLAAKLSADTSMRSVIVASIVAAIHVGILVLSTDLGTALVFFVTYLVVIFVATRDARIPLVGLGGGSVAAVIAYHLFAHVRKRVVAWKDPFAVYDTSGYQIAQGLFAIGAGGWFGTGLYMGRPDTIPVATKDFIFAAICEEFGCIFGICLILTCMSMFILIVNISLLIRNRFYKLVALGLGTEYAFQVFLTIGGVTKFIPMTGITLPLVSYGGSSVISTIIMLAIIQGLYVLREDEGEELLAKRKRSARRRRVKNSQ